MTISYNCLTKSKDGESWKGHCKTRKGGIKREQFGKRKRNVIKVGVLKLWERNEKMLNNLIVVRF
jgi:hypothetical protein